MMQLSQYND